MSKHLEKGFYTTETNGGKGFIKIAFESLADLHAADDELRAVLAQEAGKCEPVAWANGEQLKLCAASPREVQPNNPMLHNLPRNIAGSALPTEYCNTPLFASPPAPVSMVLPERFHQIMKFLNGDSDLDGFWFGDTRHGWGQFWWRLELRACLDKVKELNQ